VPSSIREHLSPLLPCNHGPGSSRRLQALLQYDPSVPRTTGRFLSPPHQTNFCLPFISSFFHSIELYFKNLNTLRITISPAGFESLFFFFTANSPICSSPIVFSACIKRTSNPILFPLLQNCWIPSTSLLSSFVSLLLLPRKKNALFSKNLKNHPPLSSIPLLLSANFSPPPSSASALPIYLIRSSRPSP